MLQQFKFEFLFVLLVSSIDVQCCPRGYFCIVIVVLDPSSGVHGTSTRDVNHSRLPGFQALGVLPSRGQRRLSGVHRVPLLQCVLNVFYVRVRRAP